MYSLKEKDEVFLNLKPNDKGVYYFKAKDQNLLSVLKQIRDEGYIYYKAFYSDVYEVNFTGKGREMLTNGGFQATYANAEKTNQLLELENQQRRVNLGLQITNNADVPKENKRKYWQWWIATGIAATGVAVAMRACFFRHS